MTTEMLLLKLKEQDAETIKLCCKHTDLIVLDVPAVLRHAGREGYLQRVLDAHKTHGNPFDDATDVILECRKMLAWYSLAYSLKEALETAGFKIAECNATGLDIYKDGPAADAPVDGFVHLSLRDSACVG